MVGSILPRQDKSLMAEICGNYPARTFGYGQLDMKQTCNTAAENKYTCAGPDACNPLSAQDSTQRLNKCGRLVCHFIGQKPGAARNID
jgi:hypothetical protein